MPPPKPVLISDDAEEDLVRLWLHIAQHDPDAADKYIRRIRMACDQVAIFPDRGTRRPELGQFARKLIVGQYVVYYDHLDDCIAVLRIFHGREDVDPFLAEFDP